MVILNTTYSVEAKEQEAWLQWLRTDYYDFLDSTGMVRNKLLTRVLVGQEGGSFSYSLQLTMDGASVYQQFEQKYLPQCEAKLIKEFGTKVVSFSTLLKVL